MKKTIISILVLALAAGGGFYVYKQSQPELVWQEQTDLSEKARKVVEERLSKTKAKIGEFNDETPEGERVSHYFAMAADYTLLGDYKKAHKAYTQILEWQPKNAGIWSTLSNLYVQVGDIEKAEEAIKKAVEYNSVSADFWKQYIEFSKGHLNASNQEIEALYQEAMDKTSKHIDVATSYAVFLEETGRIGEAIEIWKKVRDRFPDAERKEFYQKEIDRLEVIMK